MVAVFTVFFEDPFWVGLLESEDSGRLALARHVFGPEPSNAELLEFMLHRFALLPRATLALESGREGGAAAGRLKPSNPKRAGREAMRDMARRPSTKSQAALSASREASKVERRREGRAERLEREERRFELRAEKKKLRRAGKR